MDFVLTLHSHLPWVLGHGRWPHGSDWICEAALDTYLPLVAHLRALEADGIPAPVTLGVTPILGAQLSSPRFVEELESFFDQRIEACREAPEGLRSTGDEALLPLVDHWARELRRLRAIWDSIGHDLIGAFRGFQERGRLEIISSAATHGFLPLLARDESIRLQLAVGRSEHRRLFGREPKGCWVPECAYRPAGFWNPIPRLGGGRARNRTGIELFLEEAGYQYFFVDSHLVAGGSPLGASSDVPLGTERFDREREERGSAAEGPAHPDWAVERSPLVPYRVLGAAGQVTALARDPLSSMQVWSREQGYPGDEAYLEFHKIRWPGGLRFWRVTGGRVDLGGKLPYDPVHAAEATRRHAHHFAGLLDSMGGEGETGVIVAPFDTELFGHWWHEGVDFLGELFRALPAHSGVRATPAGSHLAEQPARARIRLPEGSWGKDGDFSMWLNPETEWTWERLWPLEERFWALAPAALDRPELHPILAQAARSLLLAQSSDWQFMISTGAVPDYATQRLHGHVEDATSLLESLEPEASVEVIGEGRMRASAIGERDAPFPDVLEGVARALGRDLPGR